MKPGRTPCINPRCRGTAPADKYPDEVICGKCWRALPPEIRKENRSHWREYRKWERRISRTSDEIRIGRMRNILGHHGRRIAANWQRIRDIVIAPEKPEGLDAFIEEIGL